MSPRERGLRRGLLLAGAALLVGIGVAIGVTRYGSLAGSSASPPIAETDGRADIGGPFRLVDSKGNAVTNMTLRGKPYAVFFGFTRCPDVCPTTMNRMALLHRQLGDDADKLAMLFVSVDPEHDKPADIASFLSLFDAPVVGLTGSEAELKQVEQVFRVYVQQVPLPNGDYTVDHSAAVYLMDRQGRFFEPMSASEPVDANLAQLRRLLAA